MHWVSPFPNNKLKKFAGDNSKFDEDSGKFAERVENTVGKGVIDHYEEFLHFPSVLQKERKKHTRACLGKCKTLPENEKRSFNWL